MRISATRLGRIAVSASLVATIAFGSASQAMALGTRQGHGTSAAASVERATSPAGIIKGGAQAGKAVVTSGAVRVSAPDQSRGTVTVSSAAGFIGIGLPDLGSTQPATVSAAGTVTYGTAGAGADAVQPLSDGVRVLAVAPSAKTKEFRFPITLQAGSFLALEDGGSVSVNAPIGNGAAGAVGAFQSPWAKDANGKSLPTSYRIEGNTLVQTVVTNADTAYPVVADPHYTWGIVTGTVYFNKAETGVIADRADWISVLSIFAPAPWGTLLSAYSIYIHQAAGDARSIGLCVKFKSTGVAGFYGGSDGDGYCR
jgi:hypothetical protein